MRALKAFVGSVLVFEVLLPVVYLAVVFGGCLFGISTYVIESGSMVDNDLEASELAPDEVIAFRVDGANAEVCTHRIIANDIESQAVSTKGDNNKEIDATPIPYANIIGRVVYRIPYLGFIAYFVSSCRIVIFFAYVLILASTFLLYRSISKKKTDYGKRRRNTYGIKQYC